MSLIMKIRVTMRRPLQFVRDFTLIFIDFIYSSSGWVLGSLPWPWRSKKFADFKNSDFNGASHHSSAIGQFWCKGTRFVRKLSRFLNLKTIYDLTNNWTMYSNFLPEDLPLHDCFLCIDSLDLGFGRQEKAINIRIIMKNLRNCHLNVWILK